MSLRPAEEHKLARIERRLSRSDPRLAVMLKAFGKHPFRRKGPVRERVSPWRPHARRTRVLVAAFVVVVLGVLGAIVISTGHSPSPRACGKAPRGQTGCPAIRGAGGRQRHTSASAPAASR